MLEMITQLIKCKPEHQMKDNVKQYATQKYLTRKYVRHYNDGGSRGRYVEN